ncbi:hypothetical protein ASC80_05770 [Afipia sp. Root123D2]|uniref:hypothetical protein n=1 Tax=Afipia sp. Root123D2 TaxID=1736436 RepID=UPI0006FA9F8D|nr:hypothetical protein [Afipia sp. Root123D2]KQW22848.1 hypothetical protein ASC80_05770 [Afipia sp. Root123D2]
MQKLVAISPEELHEIADAAEDEAAVLPPCPRRDLMMEQVWRMRRQANLAQWTGVELLPAEVQEKATLPTLW